MGRGRWKGPLQTEPKIYQGARVREDESCVEVCACVPVFWVAPRGAAADGMWTRMQGL